MITKQMIRSEEAICTYIRKADQSMAALGFTEHSFAHVTKVAEFAQRLLLELGYPERTGELAWIAGYMHDIGNIVNRIDHAQSGAIMAFRILDKLGCDPEELATIVSRSARILNIECDEDGALEIASRCRGTPRIANRMLKRVRDFAQVMNDGVINTDTARQALDRLEVDELGLDMVDRRMLEAMIRHYNGGPVGLDTLAAVIGEESVTIEDVYEPYLMQIGFLTRTPRGRVVLPAAYAHLGLPVPGQPSPEQPNLSFFDN